MRLIHAVCILILLIVSSFAQTPDGTRKAWIDTLNISKNSSFANIGNYYTCLDTNDLKLFDGSFAYLQEVVSGRGLVMIPYVKVAISGFRENTLRLGFVYQHADAASMWVPEEYVRTRNVRPEWYGAIGTLSIVAAATAADSATSDALVAMATDLAKTNDAGTSLIVRPQWLFSSVYALVETMRITRVVSITGEDGTGFFIGGTIPPGLVWKGSAADTMIHFVESPPGAFGYNVVELKRLFFRGGYQNDSDTYCTFGLYFGGRLDWSNKFDDIWLHSFGDNGYGAAMYVGRGSTNLHIRTFRGDNIDGDFLYIDGGAGGFMSMQNGTVDFGTSPTDTCGSLINFDNDPYVVTAYYIVGIENVHTEENSIPRYDCSVYIQNDASYPLAQMFGITFINTRVTGANAGWSSRGFWLVAQENTSDYNTVVSGFNGGNKKLLYNTATKVKYDEPGVSGDNSRWNIWSLGEPGGGSAYVQRINWLGHNKVLSMEIGKDSSASVYYPPFNFARPQGYTLTTPPVAGAFEYDGVSFWLADSNTTRRKINTGGNIYGYFNRSEDTTITASASPFSITKIPTLAKSSGLVYSTVSGVMEVNSAQDEEGRYRAGVRATVSATDTSKWLFYFGRNYPISDIAGDSVFSAVAQLKGDTASVSFEAIFDVSTGGSGGAETRYLVYPRGVRESGSGNLIIHKWYMYMEKIPYE